MARSWKQSFDRHLTQQAGIAFDAELAFFEGVPGWCAGARVVDVGCGNGAYLERLASTYPDMAFVGVDTDAELISLAESRRTSPNVEYRAVPVEDIDEPFDVLVSRFCLLYSDGTPSIARWAGRQGIGAIIEIDNDDQHRHLGPDLARTEATLTVAKRNAADGYFRTCENTTAEHWLAAGYEHAGALDLLVTSDPPSSRAEFRDWFTTVLELEEGCPIPAPLAEELLAWSVGSGRIVLGFRASYFRLGR